MKIELIVGFLSLLSCQSLIAQEDSRCQYQHDLLEYDNCLQKQLEMSFSDYSVKSIPSNKQCSDVNFLSKNHRELHREMNTYLRNQVKNQDSKIHMRPQRNNNGDKIRSNFDYEVRIKATQQFYDQHPIKYWKPRYDFYKNNGMEWKIW